MKIENLALILVLAGIVIMSGCIYLNEPSTGLMPLGPANESQVNGSQTNGSQTNITAQTNKSPAPVVIPPTTGNNLDTVIIGTYETGDTVEYLGVKGKIVFGRIVNGKVPDYLQINDETRTLLSYALANTTYGPTAIVHYPQRGTGEGEADIYVNGELIATMKYNKDASFNGYATMACEPDKYPEFTQNFTIERYRRCS